MENMVGIVCCGINTKTSCVHSTETGVYEKLVRRQLHKVSNRIVEDPEELETAADTIDALIDETANGKL